jgi:hypothetical protein
MAVRDTLNGHDKLSLTIDDKFEGSLNRIISQSSAIQRFTNNCQSANTSAWKETSKLIVNSESSILNANYTTERCIHSMENSLSIVLKNSRKSINFISKIPQKE